VFFALRTSRPSPKILAALAEPDRDERMQLFGRFNLAARRDTLWGRDDWKLPCRW
jgi:hypothetical protein